MISLSAVQHIDKSNLIKEGLFVAQDPADVILLGREGMVRSWGTTSADRAESDGHLHSYPFILCSSLFGLGPQPTFRMGLPSFAQQML